MAAVPREPVIYPPEGHTLPITVTSREPRSVKTVTEDPVHWTPDPVVRGYEAGPGFFRLTGPDGNPGDPKEGAINVWQVPLGTNMQPDLDFAFRVDMQGNVLEPNHGDWIVTNTWGDIKVWVVGPGNTFTAPIDLPDGPQGPPGPDVSAAGRHTHELVGKTAPTYAKVRDNYVGEKFTIGNAQAVTL